MLIDRILFGALALCWTTTQAQQMPAPSQDTIVRRLALPLVQDKPWAGISVAVFRDGGVYRYDFGAAGKQTLFELGSITKTFTTLLLARAVAEKKAKLTDDIRLYLDGDYPNLAYKGKPIQLINLASLTSQLPNNMPDLSGLNGTVSPDSIPYAILKLNAHYERADFLRDLHKVVLDTFPGINPRHSNAAAQLLGFILENIYHMPYEALVKKYITGPLGMGNTYMSIPADKAALLAKCYDDKGVLQPYIPANAAAAAGLKADMDDMCRYMKYQLDEGDDIVKMTHQPAWGDIRQFALGMNWFLGTSFEGRRKVSNDGTTFGFTSCCVLYPELHFGVMIMINECVSNSSIQNALYGMAGTIYNENYHTPEELSSEGFGFSPQINLLLAELNKRGFDHAIDVEAALVKSHPGFTLDENETTLWAYGFLQKGRLKDALEIFRLITSLHPDSWNAYDSEAEAYQDLGDKANAIKFYQRSLELNPQNANATEHLKKLQGN
jgi:CubicO group peptidase (beta-lactamase class C family)